MAVLTAITFPHYFLKEGCTHWSAPRQRRNTQWPGVLRLQPRGGKTIRSSVVRQRLGLQSLGRQELRRSRGGEAAHEGNQPGPAQAAALQPHPLHSMVVDSRTVGSRVINVTDWPHPAVGPEMGPGNRPARRDADADCLMTDFYAGWCFPSYDNILYRVWGICRMDRETISPTMSLGWCTRGTRTPRSSMMREGSPPRRPTAIRLIFS